MKKVLMIAIIAAAVLGLACEKKRGEGTEVVDAARKNAEAVIAEMKRLVEENPAAVEEVQARYKEVSGMITESEWGKEVRARADDLLRRSVEAFMEKATEEFNALVGEIGRVTTAENPPGAEDLAELKKSVEGYLEKFDVEVADRRAETTQKREYVRGKKKMIDNLLVNLKDYKSAKEAAEAAGSIEGLNRIYREYGEKYPDTRWVLSEERKKELADAITTSERRKEFEGIEWEELPASGEGGSGWTSEPADSWKSQNGSLVCENETGKAIITFGGSETKDLLVEFDVSKLEGDLWILFRAVKEGGPWSFDYLRVNAAMLGLEGEGPHRIRCLVRGSHMECSAGDKSITREAGQVNAGLFGFMASGKARIELDSVRIKRLNK